MIAAGQLSRKILIQSPSGAVDAANQPLGTWLDWKHKWAQPRGPNGMSTIRGSLAGVPIAPNKYSWRCNYDSNITNEMRVVYKGQLFNIIEVRHDLDRREWTDLVCETGADYG